MIKLPATWTSQPARAERSDGYRHFVVLGQRGRGRERSVELQAVLDPGVRLVVPLGELRDRTAWLPGWRRLPPDGAGVSPDRPPPTQHTTGAGGDLPLAGPR